MKNIRTGPSHLIRDIFNFGKLSPSTLHLGLPLIMPRSKSSAFAGIIRQIELKILGWKAKLLSQAGRFMLIKAVAFAIPMYGMSYFLLPKITCSELDSIFC